MQRNQRRAVIKHYEQLTPVHLPVQDRLSKKGEVVADKYGDMLYNRVKKERRHEMCERHHLPYLHSAMPMHRVLKSNLADLLFKRQHSLSLFRCIRPAIESFYKTVQIHPLGVTVSLQVEPNFDISLQVEHDIDLLDTPRLLVHPETRPWRTFAGAPIDEAAYQEYKAEFYLSLRGKGHHHKPCTCALDNIPRTTGKYDYEFSRQVLLNLCTDVPIESAPNAVIALMGPDGEHRGFLDPSNPGHAKWLPTYFDMGWWQRYETDLRECIVQEFQSAHKAWSKEQRRLRRASLAPEPVELVPYPRQLRSRRQQCLRSPRRSPRRSRDSRRRRLSNWRQTSCPTTAIYVSDSD